MPIKILRLRGAFALRALVLGVMALTGLQTARADLVQLQFRGIVVEENFRVGSTSALALGTFVDGIFAYDDQAVGQAFGSYQARYFNSVTNHQLDFAGESFTANTPGTIIIDNNAGNAFDRFTVSSASFTGTDTINGMSVASASMTLRDSSATIFSSTALPSTLDTNSFDSRSLLITMSNAGGTAVTTYRVEVTSVPEPSMFALLVLGAPVAIWLIIRKRDVKPAVAA